MSRKGGNCDFLRGTVTLRPPDIASVLLRFNYENHNEPAYKFSTSATFCGVYDPDLFHAGTDIVAIGEHLPVCIFAIFSRNCYFRQSVQMLTQPLDSATQISYMVRDRWVLPCNLDLWPFDHVPHVELRTVIIFTKFKLCQLIRS